VRGLGMLWDALGLGMRALMWSAEVSVQEEGEEKVEFSGPVAWTTIAGSLAFAIALFFLLPTLASRWLAAYVNDNAFVDAIFEGGIRLVLFLGYLWIIGRIPEIGRVFGYHGAEHKTINAYEDGAALNVEDVQRYSVQHVRCGTSFLLYVLVISIFLFAPLTFSGVEPVWLALLLRFVSRLLLIPVVAGISYEILRFSAGHMARPFMRVIIAPGLALQKLTTREPDDDMVACAIAALEPVLAADGVTVAVSSAPPSPALVEQGATTGDWLLVDLVQLVKLYVYDKVLTVYGNNIPRAKLAPASRFDFVVDTHGAWLNQVLGLPAGLDDFGQF
jgi:uncharacterized protein YqhQ